MKFLPRRIRKGQRKGEVWGRCPGVRHRQQRRATASAEMPRDKGERGVGTG
jgi:hypothetical protein